MISSSAIRAWLGVSERDDDALRRQRQRDPRFNPAMRACLGPLCLGRRHFRSEHAGHRICPACREALRRVYGVHFHDGDRTPP